MIGMPAIRSLVIGSTLAAAVGMVALDEAAAPARASDAGFRFQETTPDADDRLTRSELRWCLFESIRLDGVLAEVHANRNWGKDSYDARASTYRKNCVRKNYEEGDKAAIELELTSGKRRSLRNAGAYRVATARAEKEAQRVYVNDRLARILSAPGASAREIGRVPRWGELYATGRVQGPWFEVELGQPSESPALRIGWVLGGVLGRGSGTEARFDFCERNAGPRARHNEIVRGQVDLGRVGWLEVRNGADRDAYLKLIPEASGAVLGVLVGAGRTASVRGIPLGTYALAFAVGSLFSRGCDSFSRPGYARTFDRRLDYDRRTAGWTLTLYGGDGGDASTRSMSQADFERL